MHSSSSPTPHDAVFRHFLSQVDTAHDFLAIHLPETLRALCDLSSLRLESGSFVEEDLRLSYSDILYSVNTTAGAGYVYALIEHQSPPDRSMVFRLMLELLQKHVRQRDMLELQEQLVRLLALGYTSSAQLKTLLNYLLQAGHTTDPAAFLHALAHRTNDHQHKETLMNIAQFLREEGKAQGISQGLSQGLTQGRAEGIEQEALRIAKAMLSNGLAPEMVTKLTGLAPEIVEQARH